LFTCTTVTSNLSFIFAMEGIHYLQITEFCAYPHHQIIKALAVKSHFFLKWIRIRRLGIQSYFFICTAGPSY
jgi:hypothetical protein